ncbi:MAG: MFS transporter [Patescibacteria group bacterium]
MLLKNSAFRSLWSAQFFSQVGINLLTFILAIQTYNLTGKNTAVSLLTLSFIVPQALFGSLAGVIVERYNKKAVLFITNFSRALVVLLFLLTGETIFFIYFLAVLISLITQFFVPAEAPIIPTLVSKKDLVTANGVFMMTIFVTMLGGGLLAGPLLSMFGLNLTIVFVFLFYLLASYNITQLPKQAGIPDLKRKSSLILEFIEGKNYVLEHPKIMLAMGLLVGSQTIIATLSTLLPGFADKVLKIKVNDASVFLLGPAIFGIVLGALVISKLKITPSKIIPVGVVGAGAGMFLLGFVPNLILAQSVLFLLGFFNALVDVSCNTILQSGTGEEVRSRVYGVLTAMGGLVFILPVLLSGTLSALFGVSRVFNVFGLLILIVFTLKIRKVCRLLV